MVFFPRRNLHGCQRQLDGQYRQGGDSVADHDATAQLLGRGLTTTQT